MEEKQQKRLDPAETRKRGVILATAGLIAVLAVLVIMREAGFTEFSTSLWFVALAITLVAQFVLWLISYLGIDVRLTWDRHFVYTPLTVACVLLCFYIYVAPELRLFALMSWTIAVLFTAGLAGFFGVLGLSLTMMTGYLFAVTFLGSLGRPPGPLRFDLMVAFMFIAIHAFGGIVFERLKRERQETVALRRRLTTIALTDALTELPNRRYFQQVLEAELRRTDRHGVGFGLAIIDIDDFKSFNDSAGHLAGDQLLRGVGTVIRTQMRVSDVLSRWGGDEFILLMPSVTKLEAVRGVERLRKIVEGHGFAGRSVMASGRVTISAGVSRCPEDGTDHDSLVKKADDALYAAKRAGRNRVMESE